MAGAMRKMAVYLGLVEDDQDRDEAYFEEDEWEYDDEPTTSRRGRSSDRTADKSSRQPERPEPRTVTVVDPREPRRLYRDEPSNVAPIPGPGVRPVPAPPADLNRITTIHPHTYNDARRIGEEFREGVPVIMNLTEMDDVDAVGRAGTAVVAERNDASVVGVGRHNLGSNIFWYLTDPSGGMFEFFSDMDQIVDDEAWERDVCRRDWDGADGPAGFSVWGPVMPPPEFFRPPDLAMIGAGREAAGLRA